MKARNQVLSHKGRPDPKFSRRSTEEINLEGVMGEYAVAFVNGVPFDQVRDDTPEGDGGIDLRLEDGKTIQVKSRPGLGQREIYSKQTTLKADYAIVCLLDVRNQIARVPAWATRAKFEAGLKPHITFEGIRQGNVIQISDMTPFREDWRG